MTDLTTGKPDPTKTERVTQLLSRKTGADLATLCTATGWQPHSVRAVLSGLRKSGYAVDRSAARTEAGGPVYRITGRTGART